MSLFHEEWRQEGNKISIQPTTPVTLFISEIYPKIISKDAKRFHLNSTNTEYTYLQSGQSKVAMLSLRKDLRSVSQQLRLTWS